MKKYDYGKMKDTFKGCARGYYPKNQTSVGYMDVEGILSGYRNGEPYTGPFTLISDGSIKAGIGKYRGCDLNITSKAARKAIKSYIVRCK